MRMLSHGGWGDLGGWGGEVVDFGGDLVEKKLEWGLSTGLVVLDRRGKLQSIVQVMVGRGENPLQELPHCVVRQSQPIPFVLIS